MKKLLKPLIRFLVTNTISWRIINLFIKVANRFNFEKELIALEKKRNIQKSKEKRIKEMFADLTVKHGFFKGLLYPDYQSHGSSLYPKLLGSYESELTDLMEQICNTNYSEIIDVGCAEGFYAVGLAIRIPAATVYAYDIDSAALEACKKWRN